MHGMKCNNDVITDIKHYGVNDADLILYVTASSECKTDQSDTTDKIVLAYAFSCPTVKEFLSPIAGTINVCKDSLNPERISKLQLRETMLHEMLHIFMKNDLKGKLYVDEKGEPRTHTYSQEKCILKLPNSLAFARKYLNCPTLEGIVVDNCTHPGHVSEKTFGNVLFSPFLRKGSETGISELELALLKDTGFYQIEESYKPPFQLSMNKGKGCNPPDISKRIHGSYYLI